MPFGLKNSAATYARCMEEVLASHRSYACSYIDDIAIFSTTWETHVTHLEAVIAELEQAGYTANVQKCCFGKKEVKYLGHIVGSGQIRPDPEKIQGIQGLKAPTTKKGIRSLVGICNYYRDFIPDFATIAKPLTDKTKKGEPEKVQWDGKLEEAFQRLKQRLSTTPVLKTPQPGKPYILYCDASEIAVGACLSQADEEDKLRPVAFASRKLNDTQRRWAAVCREAYAVLWALQRFETWIFGENVTVVTDHNPLKYLATGRPSGQNSQLQRWALALQRYHVRVVHRRGACHQNADGLSRLPAEHWHDEDRKNCSWDRRTGGAKETDDKHSSTAEEGEPNGTANKPRRSTTNWQEVRKKREEFPA